MFYEIRTEHARPGRGVELAGYMAQTAIPLHEEMGMTVVGSFTVVGDEDSFIWIRRFEDDDDRERILAAVHGHPRCAAVVERVSALVGSTASTVRLAPTTGSALR